MAAHNKRRYNVSELADVIGTSRQTVHAKIKALELTADSDGKYSIMDVLAWNKPQTASLNGPPDNPRDRNDYFAAELKRLNFEKEITKLYDGDEVRTVVARLCRTLADTIDSLYDQVEIGISSDPNVLQIVQGIIDSCKSALHKTAEDTFKEGNLLSDELEID